MTLQSVKYIYFAVSLMSQVYSDPCPAPTPALLNYMGHTYCEGRKPLRKE